MVLGKVKRLQAQLFPGPSVRATEAVALGSHQKLKVETVLRSVGFSLWGYRDVWGGMRMQQQSAMQSPHTSAKIQVVVPKTHHSTFRLIANVRLVPKLQGAFCVKMPSPSCCHCYASTSMESSCDEMTLFSMKRK
eukprot:180961-Amphidinium_carterae.1